MKNKYIIGDIQGCAKSFKNLLKKIKFNFSKDILYLTGDLINKGPRSLEVLIFLKSFFSKKNLIITLGNHEFFFLSEFFKKKKNDSIFYKLLNYKNINNIVEWLINQRILYYEKKFLISHSGIYPFWNLKKIKKYAKILEKNIKKNPSFFFRKIINRNIYKWNKKLNYIDKLSFISNVFTRMRFCTKKGYLDFKYKCQPGKQPKNLFPWFTLINLKNSIEIFFGHWAYLNGYTGINNINCLDTGCVYKKKLTSIRINDKKIFSVPYID